MYIIQGNLEGILDGVYEANNVHINANLDEAKQLTRLVEDLQVLSPAEGGALSLSSQRVLLIEVLKDVRRVLVVLRKQRRLIYLFVWNVNN